MKLNKFKEKILSPIKKTADPNLIFQFCQKIHDNEEAQNAIDLIASKLLSQQEWEVMITLYVSDRLI
jgi:hypothetical protein